MALGIMIAVLALYVIVGIVLIKYVKTEDDFYTMGGRGSTLLVVGTLAATYLSATTLLGIAGQSYSEGPLVYSSLGSFGSWIGTLLAVIYVGRKMKAYGVSTMPGFFDKRFNNKWVSIVAIIIMIVGLIGYGVIQFIGAGIVLSEVTGVDYRVIVIAFTIAMLVFTAIGGMYGIVVTDTMMFFTMLAVSILIAPLLIGQAGVEQMKNLAEAFPGYWSFSGTEDRHIGWSISQFLVWILFFTCMPALVSRVFPAKNDFVILKVAIIGVFFAPFMQIMVFLAAAGVRVLEPNIADPDYAMVTGFLDYTPPAVAGVGLAALMASIMSTASTIFVLVGFALSRDLYERFFEKKLDTKQSLRAARIGQIIVGIIVCVITLMRPSAIYWVSIYAGSIFAAGWLPTIVASFEWKRMNSKAALASMIIGVASFIIVGELIRFGWLQVPEGVDALMISLVLAIVSLIAVGLFSKPNQYELDYFSTMKSTSMSRITINEFLSKPDGLVKIKKQYKQIYITAIVMITVSIAVWGGLFLVFGFN